MSERGGKRALGAALIAVFALMVVVLLAGDWRRWFHSGIRIHVEMDRSGPLIAGAVVKTAGIVIGEIERVRFVPGNGSTPGEPRVSPIVFDLWIDRDYTWLVRDNSDFFVARPAPLADAYLEIGLRAGRAPGAHVPDGATVRGISPPEIDQVLQRAYDLVVLLTDTMRQGVPEIDELLRVTAGLELVVSSFESSSADRVLESSLGLSREAILLLGALDLGHIVDIADSTIGRADALVSGGKLQVERVRARIDTLIERVLALEVMIEGGPEAALLADVEHIARAARTMLHHVDALLDATDGVMDVIGGGGTIGALINDAELVDDVRELAKILKRRPWAIVGRPRSAE